MTRRRDNDRGEPFRMGYDHAQATADASVKLWTVPTGQKLRITRVFYVNPTGLAQDPTNAFIVKITDGTNVAASWSTVTGAQGSLAANTPVELVLTATKANLTLTAGEVLTLFLDETGDTTLPAGRVVVEGYLV